MWVVKTPQRWDFCGCPGCPLCYDWAEDTGEQIGGMEKWKNDLLGPYQLPTDLQEAEINAAAEKFHSDALVRSVDPGPPLVPTLGEVFELEWTKMSVESFLAEKRKEAARPPPAPPLNKANLDDIGFGESEELEKKSPGLGFIILDESKKLSSREFNREVSEFTRNYAAKYPDRELPPRTWFEEKVAEKYTKV